MVESDNSENSTMSPSTIQAAGGIQSLELRIPPVAIVIICLFLMWLVRQTVPRFTFRFDHAILCAAILALLGVSMIALGIRTFRRAKTTIDPRSPDSATSMVEIGIYKWTRNPMYFGLLMILTAAAVGFRNYLGFAMLPLFYFYMTRFQIIPEERALEHLFPEAYSQYKLKVRRWI